MDEKKRKARPQPRLYDRLPLQLVLYTAARVPTPDELWKRLWGDAKGEYDIESRDRFLRGLYEAIRDERGPEAAAEFYWRMKESGIDFFEEDKPNSQP